MGEHPDGVSCYADDSYTFCTSTLSVVFLAYIIMSVNRLSSSTVPRFVEEVNSRLWSWSIQNLSEPLSFVGFNSIHYKCDVQEAMIHSQDKVALYLIHK